MTAVSMLKLINTFVYKGKRKKSIQIQMANKCKRKSSMQKGKFANDVINYKTEVFFTRFP